MSGNCELPTGWAWTTLGDVTESIVEQRGPDGNGTFAYVDISSIDRATKTIAEPKVIPVDQAPSRARQRLCAGDVIVSMTRPNLNAVALVPPQLDGATGSTGFHILRSPRVRPNWLAYLVQTHEFISAMSALVLGVLYPAVRPKDIAAYRFALPPVHEQDRIVGEIEKQLTRLDAAVAALNRVQANLKRYRASVLKAACEGRLVPTEVELARKEGRPYEPAGELLKRILQERRAKWEADKIARMRAAGRPPKDDAWKSKYAAPRTPGLVGAPPLPDGWAWASLEQLTSAARPICYGILMPKDNVADGVLYVRVKDMKGDKIDVAALHRTRPDIAAEYARASLKTGDLLLAIRGTYGRVATVPPDLDGGNITQDTVRLEIADAMNRDYVAACLRSAFVQTYFKRVARGVAVKGVNVADVRTCPVAVPPRRGQDRIVEALGVQTSTVDEVELEVRLDLARADRLRQSILKRSFAGKLVPQDPNDEPASLLLERIRAERAAKLELLEVAAKRPIRRAAGLQTKQ